MPQYWKLKARTGESEARKTERLRTIAGLKRLRAALKEHFLAKVPSGEEPPDRMKTVRICTWNLRDFGTKKYGGRDTDEPIHYIAEIISNFDIVAVQEVKADMRDFRRVLSMLGPDWDYLATDVTDGSFGNGGRMVFLFNTTRARFSNIAGELTLPDGKKILASFGERLKLEEGIALNLPDGTDLSGVYEARSEKARTRIKLDEDVNIPLPAGTTMRLPDGASLSVARGATVTRPAGTRGQVQIDVPQRQVEGEHFRLRFPGSALDESFKQFARTPYIVSFQTGWLKINLATVHIYFGSNEDEALLAQRRREIESLTEALGDRARAQMKSDPDNRTVTALLGDFNILSPEHETMSALERNGFEVPPEIRTIPGSNVDKTKAYDQIAFWEPRRNRGYAKVDIQSADVFDFFEHVYRESDQDDYLPGVSRGRYRTWRTFKMSDHLPMWVELTSDFSDNYIDALDEDGSV